MMATNSFDLPQIIRSRQQMFLRLIFIALLLAMGRYLFPWPNNWLRFVSDTIFFILGVCIAPLTFLTETTWKSFLEKRFQMKFTIHDSPLRMGLLLLLVPVLGIFVLTSSRAPIGLGFLWGISAWYTGEVWRMLQGDTNLLTAYFPAQTQRNELPLTTILWGYCLYAVLLTLGILLI